MDEVRSRLRTGLATLVIFTAVWFALAGRITWWQGWLYVLSFSAYVGALLWRLSKRNPNLIRERNQPIDKAEPWDRLVIRIYNVVVLVLLVVAALDGGRFQWSTVPLGIQMVGWFLLVIAGLIIWHVMMINAFLSSWARLQEERGQVVVQEGAYGYIRHPMYLGVILAFLGIPIALGSWYALIPGLLVVSIYVYRTYREDLMLIDGLTGYEEYSKKVKYRLVPGIW